MAPSSSASFPATSSLLEIWPLNCDFQQGALPDSDTDLVRIRSTFRNLWLPSHLISFPVNITSGKNQITA
ncbi:unnamed protein product [Victoria cruziana]